MKGPEKMEKYSLSLVTENSDAEVSRAAVYSRFLSISIPGVRIDFRFQSILDSNRFFYGIDSGIGIGSTLVSVSSINNLDQVTLVYL